MREGANIVGVDWIKDLGEATHEATKDYWNNVMRTNATGMFMSLRARLGQMVAQGRGRSIGNLGSFAGMTGLAGNPACVASRRAVNRLKRNAAIDYAPFGIRVNSVNMAATDTPMVERAGILVRASSKDAVGPSIGRTRTQSILSYTDTNQRVRHCRATGVDDAVPVVA